MKSKYYFFSSKKSTTTLPQSAMYITSGISKWRILEIARRVPLTLRSYRSSKYLKFWKWLFKLFNFSDNDNTIAVAAATVTVLRIIAEFSSSAFLRYRNVEQKMEYMQYQYKYKLMANSQLCSVAWLFVSFAWTVNAGT